MTRYNSNTRMHYSKGGEYVKFSEAEGMLEKKDAEIMELKALSEYWYKMWKGCNEV